MKPVDVSDPVELEEAAKVVEQLRSDIRGEGDLSGSKRHGQAPLPHGPRQPRDGCPEPQARLVPPGSGQRRGEAAMVKKSDGIDELKFVAKGLFIGIIVLVIYRVFHIDHYLSLIP